jgi:heme exporter protein C
MYSAKLRTLAVATAIILTGAFVMAAFYAPIEADQGFSQKIFYVHVPMAIVALGGFVWGGIQGLLYLRTRDAKHDMRSYVAIHMSVILGLEARLTKLTEEVDGLERERAGAADRDAEEVEA